MSGVLSYYKLRPADYSLEWTELSAELRRHLIMVFVRMGAALWKYITFAPPPLNEQFPLPFTEFL